MTYKVIIRGKFYGDRVSPSWNDRISASARHFAEGGKMERDFVMICANAIRMQLKGAKVKTPIGIRYTFYEKDKRRDLGNLAFIDKPFEDALHRCGYIYDDGPTYVRALSFSLGEVDSHNPRVEVDIEEL
jgi:Holliday junction resolvase RusA-like endonuclease